MIRLVRWSMLTVFCNGRYLQQPVHVSDMSWAVVQALNTPATIGRQFNISGAALRTYIDVVRLTAQALGRSVQRFHLPGWPIVTPLQVSERLGITLPIKVEQVLRLNEDKAFSHAEAAEAFSYSPMDFEQGIRHEVALLCSGRDGLNF